MSRVFYEKRGRRYYPVAESDPDAIGALTEGAYLLIVQPGQRRFLGQIDPDYASLAAAAEPALDAIAKAIVSEYSKLDCNRKLTTEQAAAWQAFKATLGGGSAYITRPSAFQIARAGFDAILATAKKVQQ